jgi:hypothetical protein
VNADETRAAGEHVAGGLRVWHPIGGAGVVADDEQLIGDRTQGASDAVDDSLTADDLEAFGITTEPRRRSAGEYRAC